MTDEEKEAIKRIKSELDINEFMPRLVFNDEDIKIVINLIEKQSKEIEELKEESKEYQIGFAQGCYERDLDWNDKIEAKIEELEEYLYKGNIKDDFLMIRIKAKIQELQSLLEKE